MIGSNVKQRDGLL